MHSIHKCLLSVDVARPHTYVPHTPHTHTYVPHACKHTYRMRLYERMQVCVYRCLFWVVVVALCKCEYTWVFVSYIHTHTNTTIMRAHTHTHTHVCVCVCVNEFVTVYDVCVCVVCVAGGGQPRQIVIKSSILVCNFFFGILPLC